ncbi:patched domain-containing protein 3-like isoform X1 [Biomphalaria glabrata]|uniref:Patched domain-containing protein 3-like isoform X1 n=2 Tax=Biomphalaria glabrata TaxID=6526 RepID=A0A9W3ACG3_BIOGL|nr:patched domain-containing protein 3-like isoform X1 [Biomphalaria glabrata]
MPMTINNVEILSYKDLNDKEAEMTYSQEPVPLLTKDVPLVQYKCEERRDEFTMKCLWNCHRFFLRCFYHYGYFLASHPAWFLILPIVMCTVLAVGFIKYSPERDVEVLYAPINSRAVQDRQKVMDTFPDLSATNYQAFSLNKLLSQGVVIFKSRNDMSILTPEVLQELEAFRDDVMALRVLNDKYNFTFEEVCLRRANQANCVFEGDILLAPYFKLSLRDGNVTYPLWRFGNQGLDLSLYISNVNLTHNVFLKSAGSVKLTFPLRQDTPEMKAMSSAWEAKFLEFMKEANYSSLEAAFSTSQSLNIELDKGTKGDILYFSLTFTLMITYACLVSAGGDCISTRAFLASAGVFAAGVGIMGAFGLITYAGVSFVNIVGVMPFLTLGIGVDDMFLLMGTWSETTAVKGLTIPERIGLVFKKAGVGITITSLTDCLAFAVGSMSVFKSVQNFCIYTGAGVLLCYICNATFFAACLTYHGRRVYSGLHTVTCKKVESRATLKNEGNGCVYAYMCGGSIPEGPNDDQSVCEKAPKFLLTNFVLFKPIRIIILIFFAIYLGVSIWGCTKLEQGLELKHLVLESSYFHKFQVWDTEEFGSKLPIAFVTIGEKDYKDPRTLENIVNLLTETKKDKFIDKYIDNCWLQALKQTPFYNNTDDDVFFDGLNRFLFYRPGFRNDIVFGEDNKSIIASRCHAYSLKITDSNDQASLMTRMRDLADSSSANVFAYHPAFVYFEQYLSIMSSTLQTVGVTLAVMFVVTCVFIPQPMIVVIVMVQVVMIVTGIFGFMAHWGLTLSSVTMIHLIMSVGFSVDFCAHVCTAYIVSEEKSREDRARDAIVHASGPIFNGGVSSILGVVMLYFTESYIFQSFFKIMVLVIGFGVLHAVFLIPVVLAYFGPSTYVDLEDRMSQSPTSNSVNPQDALNDHNQASIKGSAASSVVSNKKKKNSTASSKLSNKEINLQDFLPDNHSEVSSFHSKSQD